MMQTRDIRKIHAAALLFLCAGLPQAASAEEATPQWCLDEVLRRVPPLRNDAAGRWPLVIWENFPLRQGDDSYQRGKPLPAEAYKELARRGLAEHIRLDPVYIEMARAIQGAGSKVILVQGFGGPGPYAHGNNEGQWAHQFPPDYRPRERVRACPLLFEGWIQHAGSLRATLRQFQEAKVTLDAAWLDYEGDPYEYWGESFIQAGSCLRCRQMFPPGVLDSVTAFIDFSQQLAQELVGAYWAGPIRSIYPFCSVTNWDAAFSTPQHQARLWVEIRKATIFPPLFTATNPVAYGNTNSFKVYMLKDYLAIQSIADYRPDPAQVDRMYTHVLMRAVSADATNMALFGIQKEAIPWVCRWCPDDEDPRIPILSRSRYREILKHLWLRGVDGMQIFNPVRSLPNATEIILGELEDAVKIYDEMLEFREFLERGEVMNTLTPGLDDEGPVWSGLRLEHRALVRVFTQSAASSKIWIEAWPGLKVELEARPEGQTCFLRKENDRVEFQVLPLER